MRLTPELESLAAGRTALDVDALLPPEMDPLLFDSPRSPAPPPAAAPPPPPRPVSLETTPGPRVRVEPMPTRSAPQPQRHAAKTSSAKTVRDSGGRWPIALALLASAAAGYCTFLLLQTRHDLAVLTLKVEKFQESMRKEVDDKISKAVQDVAPPRPAPTLAEVEALGRELDKATSEILSAKAAAVAAPAAKKNSPDPPLTKNSKGRWVVNIVSEKSKDKLKTTEARLRKAGLAPEFVEVRIAGTTWHRLRIANYPNREQALAHSAEISKQFGIPSVWVEEM